VNDMTLFVVTLMRLVMGFYQEVQIDETSYAHGMATYYTLDQYGGMPLYASDYLRYEVNGVHWCAVDVREFESGRVHPGDTLLIKFLDMDTYMLLDAWDAGPFIGYYIEDHPELPILIDIPQHLWPADSAKSAEVTVVNLSRVMEAGIDND